MKFERISETIIMRRQINFNFNYIIYLIFVFVFSVSCKDNSKQSFMRSPVNTVTKDNITIEVYDYDNFEPFLNQKNDVTYVVNFWATWCKPCIEELAYFEQIGEKYKDKNVKMLLVSLDFPENIESGLIPYIKNNNLKSEVILLDAPDANAWIPKVDKDWSGSIPATLIYNKEKRAFYEQSFTYEELENEIHKFINQ